jgi:hypothetical protein
MGSEERRNKEPAPTPPHAQVKPDAVLATVSERILDETILPDDSCMVADDGTVALHLAIDSYATARAFWRSVRYKPSWHAHWLPLRVDELNWQLDAVNLLGDAIQLFYVPAQSDHSVDDVTFRWTVLESMLDDDEWGWEGDHRIVELPPGSVLCLDCTQTFEDITETPEFCPV